MNCDAPLQSSTGASGGRGSVLRRDEARDARDRAEAVDFKVLQGHPDTEPRFQLSQEFHEGQGVNEARVDQVGLHRRHLDLQLLCEEPAKLVLEASRIGHCQISWCSVANRSNSKRSYGRPSI